LGGQGEPAGGGSGGTVRITAETFAGSGSITANGGNGHFGGGSGAGGRIAIAYGSNTFSGTLSAHGGQTAVSGQLGGAGTIYMKANGASVFDLMILNGANTAGVETPLTVASDFGGDEVRDFKAVNSRPEITGSLTVTGITDLTGSTVTVTGSFDADQLLLDSATLSAQTITTTQPLTVPANCSLQHPAEDTAGLTVTAPNLTVDASGSINASNRGYDGGNAVAGSGPSGGPDGGGGAGHGGTGGNGGGSANGSLATPDALGSSGGGTNRSGGTTKGGDGGGKVILDIEGTLTLNGSISANGGTGFHIGGQGNPAGGGAGGSVQISTGTFDGNGSIAANGGNGFTNGGSGAGGRIAISYDTDTFQGTLSAAGGQSAGDGNRGGAGTIYLKDNAAADFDLTIDNGANGADEDTPLTPSADFGGEDIGALNVVNAKPDVTESLTVTGTADFSGSSPTVSGTIDCGTLFLETTTLTAQGVTVNSDLTLPAGVTLRHGSGDTTGLTVTAPNLSIESTGSINVNGRGHGGGSGVDGSGEGGGTGGDGGGAHGGNGGESAGGSAYGSLAQPDDLGSGGAGTNRSGSTKGGNGGGKIFLDIAGTLTLDGSLSANGGNGVYLGGQGNPAGGGSGGTVRVAAGSFDGAGSITANGGNGLTGGGSGAGGRIAIHYDSETFSGTLSARGSHTAGSGDLGGAGTIFLKENGTAVFDLTVDNGGTLPDEFTPIDPDAQFAGDDIDSLTITNAKADLDGMLVNPGGTVTIDSGTLKVRGTYSQSGGTTELIEGTLDADDTVTIDGGTLKGSGNINANVKNSGNLEPGNSTAILNINGDYEQTATGTFEIELGGTAAGTDYDQLDVSGSATLAGELSAVLIDSFAPALNDSFEIIQASSVIGTFSARTLPVATGNLLYHLGLGPPVILTLIQPITYADWKALEFLPAEQADDNLSGPLVDFDGDGLANILDYAFGTAPKEASSVSALRSATVIENEQTYLTATFPWEPKIGDYAYTLQASQDLDNWDTADTDDPPGFDSVDGLARKTHKKRLSGVVM